MGLCLSSVGGYTASLQHTANVISVNGNLRQYRVPMTASEVLHSESSSSFSSSSSYFLCNSDRLIYDDYIPEMGHDDDLEAGQIYFVLPAAKLNYRLSATDMAALAVKASVALQKTSGSSKIGDKKARISPVLGVNANRRVSGDRLVKKPTAAASGNWPRSASVKKLQRYSSTRAKLAVRSFRLRLTTIHEASVLQFY